MLFFNYIERRQKIASELFRIPHPPDSRVGGELASPTENEQIQIIFETVFTKFTEFEKGSKMF
jgi:hypothetical protein